MSSDLERELDYLSKQVPRVQLAVRVAGHIHDPGVRRQALLRAYRQLDNLAARLSGALENVSREEESAPF